MKNEAIKSLETFIDAVRDDRVCPKKALKLGNAAANIIMPEPLVQEPVADSQLEEIEQEEAPVDPVAPVVEDTPPVEEAGPVEDPAEAATADLLAAINLLDPTNDDHWTQSGAPAIAAIEEIYGNDTTRSEVNEVAPGYDRDAAAAK